MLVIVSHHPISTPPKKTHNTTLRNHRLDLLGRKRLLKQVHHVELERVEKHIAGDEQLVRLAESEKLKRPHQLLVLLYAFTHFE